MKDGRTHMAHKAEHAVDMDTQAIVAVTLQGADQGDTTSLWKTMEESGENLREVTDDPLAAACIEGPIIQEAVTDKGYHSNDTCRDMKEVPVRTYFSEPDRGRRVWTDRDTGEVKSEEQAAVRANRRRIRGGRGKALLRKRGELLERSFAHCYETGGMRRVHLRGHANILKRLLVHVAGFNLGLVMRSMFGAGKPRCLQGGLAAFILAVFDQIVGLPRGPGALQACLRPRWPVALRSLGGGGRCGCVRRRTGGPVVRPCRTRRRRRRAGPRARRDGADADRAPRGARQARASGVSRRSAPSLRPRRPPEAGLRRSSAPWMRSPFLPP